jgi:uncharacterized protein (TIGR02421 family)
MTASTYRQKIKSLSDQLVAIQRPIMILDAIKWPRELQKQFFNNGGREPPPIDASYYKQYRFNFDPEAKRQELKQLRRAIVKDLGKNDALGKILRHTVDQYLIVIDMLQQRGQPGFMSLSQELYGSARSRLRGDKKTIVELGERLCHIFSLPAATHLARPYPKKLSAQEAVSGLQKSLGSYFDSADFKVILSDGIVSDASAGGDSIKINSNARFSELDLKVLEVHEGWVHIGSTLNGRRQPWATWLSVGSPRITATQEGLAIIMETLTFSSFPNRARRVSDRVVAIDMAEQGADFIQVYRYFVDNGLSEHDSYIVAQRTFRGGDVKGGACFTKDLSYVKGFVETVNFIRSAILSGVPEILPMLFVGKVTLDDLPTLYQHSLEGLIEPPEYLPPMFRDLNGLYTWFGFSSGMTLVDLGRVKRHFEKLFATLPVSSPLMTAKQDVEID